jgi:ferredoxin-NADP reductase
MALVPPSVPSMTKEEMYDDGVVVATMSHHDDAVPSSPRSLWTVSGVPTRLIRKKTLVEAACDGPNTDTPPLRLPVHTLTFAMPPSRDDDEEEENDEKKKKNEKHNGNKKKKIRLHHRDLRLDYGDVVKMVIPNYKPKSYSVSALRDDEFDVTVKIYPNGRASGYLDRLNIHDEIYTFGLSKGLRRCDDISITHVGVIAYGVGITEALPVVAAELLRSSSHHDNDNAPNVVATLLWAARTQADTFWHDELAELRRTYPHTFRLQYIFSREKDESCFVAKDDDHPADPLPPPLQGRIDAAVLQRVFAHWPNQSTSTAASSFQPRFMSVGTKEMMAETDQMLAAIGYPMPQYALLK